MLDKTITVLAILSLFISCLTGVGNYVRISQVHDFMEQIVDHVKRP